MAAPEEKNVLVVGDGPLVGDDETLVIDKGGATILWAAALVDGEGVVVDGRLSCKRPGGALGALAVLAVSYLDKS